MKERFTTAILIIILVVPLVLFSQYIVYPIVLGLLCVGAFFEIVSVIGASRILSLTIPGYLICAALPILGFFFGSITMEGYAVTFLLVFLAYLLYSFAVSVLSKGKIPISKVSEVFFALFYVTVSFLSLALLRYMDTRLGFFFVALVFIVAWLCDVGAYLVGSVIGRHKLIPEVSPKKTVEGAIGGVLFGVICYIIFGYAVDLIDSGVSVNYLLLAILGAVLSVISQLGDLAASLIKREHGVKDYGNLFPGHGGIMDRFDSILSVSFPVLIICTVCPPFTLI